MDHLGENWKGFSHDGRFEEGNYLAIVAGFEWGVGVYPVTGYCYELVVEYEGEDDFCFYTGFLSPIFGCSGDNQWLQVAPELRLTDNNTGVKEIPRAEWRRKYANQ